jgi:hypothetical protein
MKEKILDFVKSKLAGSRLSNMSPEAKFIIWGIFYTVFALNILTIFRIFDLFIFFGIYFCYKHLISMPAFNKKRWFVSSVIIVILIIEAFALFNFVFFTFLMIFNFGSRENNQLTRLISLFFFFIYWITARIKSNPNKISEIFKTTFYEYFQLFAVVIFYICTTLFILKKYDLPYMITLMIINIIILASTNVLSKKTSTILEILCFGYLFLNLAFFSIQTKNEHISAENNVAIFLVILNFIGIAIVFLKNKNYAEKTKIILLAILMPTLFFSSGPIIYLIYLIFTFMIIRLIIVNEKLSILNASIFFILLIIAIFIMSIPLSVGRGGGPGFALMIFSLIEFVMLPIIVFLSYRTLKKRKLKMAIELGN